VQIVEVALTILVLVVVITTAVVFVLVYHDFPVRVS
jgi:hypothetical protein